MCRNFYHIIIGTSWNIGPELQKQNVSVVEIYWRSNTVLPLSYFLALCHYWTSREPSSDNTNECDDDEVKDCQVFIASQFGWNLFSAHIYSDAQPLCAGNCEQVQPWKSVMLDACLWVQVRCESQCLGGFKSWRLRRWHGWWGAPGWLAWVAPGAVGNPSEVTRTGLSPIGQSTNQNAGLPASANERTGPGLLTGSGVVGLSSGWVVSSNGAAVRDPFRCLSGCPGDFLSCCLKLGGIRWQLRLNPRSICHHIASGEWGWHFRQIEKY